MPHQAFTVAELGHLESLRHTQRFVKCYKDLREDIQKRKGGKKWTIGLTVLLGTLFLMNLIITTILTVKQGYLPSSTLSLITISVVGLFITMNQQANHAVLSALLVQKKVLDYHLLVLLEENPMPVPEQALEDVLEPQEPRPPAVLHAAVIIPPGGGRHQFVVPPGYQVDIVIGGGRQDAEPLPQASVVNNDEPIALNDDQAQPHYPTRQTLF